MKATLPCRALAPIRAAGTAYGYFPTPSCPACAVFSERAFFTSSVRLCGTHECSTCEVEPVRLRHLSFKLVIVRRFAAKVVHQPAWRMSLQIVERSTGINTEVVSKISKRAQPCPAHWGHHPCSSSSRHCGDGPERPSPPTSTSSCLHSCLPPWT